MWGLRYMGNLDFLLTLVVHPKPNLKNKIYLRNEKKVWKEKLWIRWKEATFQNKRWAFFMDLYIYKILCTYASPYTPPSLCGNAPTRQWLVILCQGNKPTQRAEHPTPQAPFRILPKCASFSQSLLLMWSLEKFYSWFLSPWFPFLLVWQSWKGKNCWVRASSLSPGRRARKGVTGRLDTPGEEQSQTQKEKANILAVQSKEASVSRKPETRGV